MGDVISKIWKTDDGKKRSFKDLKISLEKIETEFSLLQVLSETISNPKEESLDLDRAIKDSYLIHFRRIHNFLYSKDQDADTIIAEDFFESGEKWKSTRIKETKIIKAFEKLANRVLLSFSFGDDAVIREISSKDFNNAVDEIRKPFQQFIELNLPVEIPEEPIFESEDLEEIPAMELEVEVTGKDYGVDKVMYRTVILDDGYLEVQVFHANQNVRKLIDTHTDDPKYFSDNIEKFTDHKQRARKWLADVVIDYRSYFDENRVTFEMIDL